MNMPDADAAHWRELLGSVDAGIRKAVGAVVDQAAEELAHRFYNRLLALPETAALLSHALVNQRLHASLARWLRELFVQDRPIADHVAAQRATGAVHARVGVAIDWIGLGARELKRGIGERLAARELASSDLARAIQYVYELMDVALDEMNTAYASNASRIERTEEAYRIMFLGRDLRAERERQRSQLLEWAQQILMHYYWNLEGTPPAGGNDFAASQFGLWLQHKASMLFDGAPEIDEIRRSIETIEGELLPRLSSSRDGAADPRPTVAAINGHIESIKRLLSSMFDTYIDNQDGRDSVTQLLSRRYLPSVARREIALAGDGRKPFALLMVDLDHFARIRGAFDPEAADLVLAQVANLLVDSLRAGDFIFRIGDDRFAILVVEAGAEHALRIADQLRRQIEAMTFRGPSGTTTYSTASIGVAVFDGHPDYQRLLDRAEQALLRAKANGRNLCEMAA